MSGDVAPLSVAACARRLAERETTARALLDEVAARIERLDARLGCYVARTLDLAAAQAREADARLAAGGARSPLDGVPVAFKDNVDVAGVASTNGTGRARVAREDAAVVHALRAAGAVFLGKLNMEEGALGAVTDNPHHGRTHNPHRAGHTAGGSSGGAGAAVAAGLAAAALGTDTLGSVRIPAAYCGVVGFKPSRGAASLAGVAALAVALDCVGPLAASVADAALVYEVMTGARPGPGAADLARVRVGRIDALDAVALDAGVARAVARARARVASVAGPAVPIALPGYEPSRVRRAALLLVEREAEARWRAEMAAHPAAFSARLRAMLAFGRDASEARVAAARERMAEAARALREALARADVVIAAATPQAAFPFGRDAPPDQADLTAAANVAGAPALALPCGETPDGLPVGLQIVGRPGEDARVLAIGAAVERVLAG